MRTYKFQGFRFDIIYHGGPVSLKLGSTEPRVTYPVGFWRMWDAFEKLSTDDREKFEIDPWEVKR